MSERAQDVLSSEELDAILASVASSASQEEGTVVRRRSGPDLRTGALARPLRNLMEEQARLLSTLHQRSIRFEPVGSIQAGTGSAGSLIPPHEYHTIANPSDEHVAVSVHVYSGAMTECNVSNPDGDGWYRRCPRRLSLD